MIEIKFRPVNGKYVTRVANTFEQVKDHIRDYYFPEMEDKEIGEWDYSSVYEFLQNAQVSNIPTPVYLFNNCDEYGRTAGMGGVICVGYQQINQNAPIYLHEYIADEDITCIIRRFE